LVAKMKNGLKKGIDERIIPVTDEYITNVIHGTTNKLDRRK